MNKHEVEISGEQFTHRIRITAHGSVLEIKLIVRGRIQEVHELIKVKDEEKPTWVMAQRIQRWLDDFEGDLKQIAPYYEEMMSMFPGDIR